MNKKFFTIIIITILAVVLKSYLFASWESNYNSGYLFYTTMSLVENLNEDVSSITPSIDDSDIPLGTAELYLHYNSCLGYYGPLGPYGPLGVLGPIGTNNWETYGLAQWFPWDLGYTWQYWQTYVLNPTLGPNGPLGENGPVDPSQYYGIEDPGQTLFQENDFAQHSRALGVWNPLGPIGPLGALGALGALGPLGFYGAYTNSNGEYIYNNNIVRSVTMCIDENNPCTERTYELYEHYTERFAKSMINNDTSFMVTGKLFPITESDEFVVTSNVNQLVSIVVVPVYEYDTFSINVELPGGAVIITDTQYASTPYIQWVQIKIPAGTEFKIIVKKQVHNHVLQARYRLFVTGSTAELNQTEISGNHILNW